MRDNETFQNRPITMNNHNNLLEIEEHMYILDDVKKPNVFRNMFPYSEIPKIPFNDRIEQFFLIFCSDRFIKICAPQYAEGDLDHGHDLPGRTAVQSAVHHGADCDDI